MYPILDYKIISWEPGQEIQLDLVIDCFYNPRTRKFFTYLGQLKYVLFSVKDSVISHNRITFHRNNPVLESFARFAIKHPNIKDLYYVAKLAFYQTTLNTIEECLSVIWTKQIFPNLKDFKVSRHKFKIEGRFIDILDVVDPEVNPYEINTNKKGGIKYLSYRKFGHWRSKAKGLHRFLFSQNRHNSAILKAIDENNINGTNLAYYTDDGRGKVHWFLALSESMTKVYSMSLLKIYELYYENPNKCLKLIYKFDVFSLYIVFINFVNIYQTRKIYSDEINLKINTEMNKYQKEAVIKEKISLLSQELNNSKYNKEELFKEFEEKAIPQHIRNEIISLVERQGAGGTLTDANQLNTIIKLLLSLPYKPSINAGYENKRFKDSFVNIFGLDLVKEQLETFLHINSINSENIPKTTLTLNGLPGIGKTAICKALAKALNRELITINIGSIDDVTMLTGHKRTYVGSMPGRIIESMSKVPYNNPVLLLDEIDKYPTYTSRGNIISTLLALLDPIQKTTWTDNFINVPYDLSNVLIVATSNNVNVLPAPIRDRLTVINLEPLSKEEKVDILTEIYIPKFLKEFDFKWKIDKQLWTKLLSNLDSSAGMRQALNICLTIISAVSRKLVKPVFEEIIELGELQESRDYMKHLIQTQEIEEPGQSRCLSVVNGELGQITVISSKLVPIKDTDRKRGSIKTIGDYGESFKLGKQVSIIYYYNWLLENLLSKYDIYWSHKPVIMPVDGNSGDISYILGTESLISQYKFPAELACTGALELTGEISAIGGLKPKLEAAYYNNMKYVIIPSENYLDLELIKRQSSRFKDIVNNHIKIIYCDRIEQAIEVFYILKKIDILNSLL